MILSMWSSPCKSWIILTHFAMCNSDQLCIVIIIYCFSVQLERTFQTTYKNLLWNKETELDYFSQGSSKVVWKILLISMATNANCLCMSVLKCGKMKPDGITNKVFVLGGYSKCRDRSIDKQWIEYCNLLTSASQLGTTGLCY